MIVIWFSENTQIGVESKIENNQMREWRRTHIFMIERVNKIVSDANSARFSGFRSPSKLVGKHIKR